VTAAWVEDWRGATTTAQGGGKSDGGEKIRVRVRDELVYIL
jgi:hypothetical protein